MRNFVKVTTVDIICRSILLSVKDYRRKIQGFRLRPKLKGSFFLNFAYRKEKWRCGRQIARTFWLTFCSRGGSRRGRPIRIYGNSEICREICPPPAPRSETRCTRILWERFLEALRRERRRERNRFSPRKGSQDSNPVANRSGRIRNGYWSQDEQPDTLFTILSSFLSVRAATSALEIFRRPGANARK